MTILEIEPKKNFYKREDALIALSEEKEYVETKMAEAFMNNRNPIFKMANGEKIEIVINLIEIYEVYELEI